MTKIIILLIFIHIINFQIVCAQEILKKDLVNKSTTELGQVISKKVYNLNNAQGNFAAGKKSIPVNVDESEIKMFFSANDLDEILLKKEFFNSHQAGKSNGNDRADIVKNLENKIAATSFDSNVKNLETKLNELRPKYAIIDFPEMYKHITVIDEGENFVFSESYKSEQYGQISAVFNPEVKSRTTISLQDSGDYVNTLNRGGKINKYFTGLNGSKQININPKGLAGARYIEAQIWGQLTLADVEYFILDTDVISPDEVKKIIKSLKKTGIPIFAKGNAEDEWVKRFEYYGKGKNLSPGDKQIRTQFLSPCDEWF